MEEFFRYSESLEQMLWVEPEPNVNFQKRSAFDKYGESRLGFGNKIIAKTSNRNVNKRMIEFVRRSQDRGTESKELERDRCYKHMMNERLRRKNQKNNYSALHALLPPRTKNDKKTIVQIARKEIIDLKNYKEELVKSKRKIEAILARRDQEVGINTRAATIRLRVTYPLSGIDSTLEFLKCIKNIGFAPTPTHIKFSSQELSVFFEFGSEVEAAEIEKFVERIHYFKLKGNIVSLIQYEE